MLAKYTIRTLAIGGAVCLLSACSIHKYRPEGDVLYTGIKSIKVEDNDHSADAENALLAVEEQLAYPPNNSMFGSSSTRLPLPLYRPYLYLKYADSKTWLGKRLHRLGSKPVWIRDVNPKLRAKVGERILGEHGYLGAKIESQILPSKQEGEAKVAYRIKLGELYRLDSVNHLSPISLSDSIELRHREISSLQKGKPYSVAKILEDRLSFSHRLREAGFYFYNPNYLSYEADSLHTPYKIRLRSKLQEGLSPDVLCPWKIRKVRVRFYDTEEGVEQNLQSDTILIADRIKAYYNGRLPIRPKVLNSRIRLRPDSLYRQSIEDLTIKSLASIGAFASTEVFYTPRQADSLHQEQSPVMDMTILMRADKPWHITLGAQFQHKTNNFIGPGGIVQLSRRNLFGGGENLSINANASYEWQTGKSPFSHYTSALNSYQFGVDVSLLFPTLLIPGWLDHYFAYPTTTQFKLSGQRLNRAGYYGLNNIGFSMAYDYQPTPRSTHNIKVLGIDYTQLAHTTSVFNKILAENPSLALSLSSQLIPSMGYSYTWHKPVGKKEKSTLWLRTSVSEAGNLTKAVFLAAGKPFNATQRILGVPYAQFVKGSTELRFTKYIDRYQSLAMRAMLGAIYSYGNMQRAPYIEQFYVGGASSIRAFTVRSLGPGRFRNTSRSSYTFMDHVGEAKLEANLEFRRYLTQSLEFALFLDAGNVWLLRPDPERVGGSFSEVRGIGDFLNQIAVGTGIGLRYDMSYLLIRLDAGIGLHLPYETNRKGWYNIPRFSDGFGLHLAIGYPF